jgi:competence protein ComEC
MIAKHKGEIPVVVLLLPFLVGISGGFLFPVTQYCITLIALAVLSLLFTGLNLWYAPFKVYKIRWLGGTLIFRYCSCSGYSLPHETTS